MLFLRRLFNWFKLLVALDFMVVSVVLVASERQEFEKGIERWGPLVVVGFVMFCIGLVLLIWFIRIWKKHSREFLAHYPDALESVFYLRYPKFSKFMDGWSFNGIGSKFMTWSGVKDDGSVYATKWIVLGFFPAVPLYRQRLKIVAEKEKIHIPFFAAVSKLEFISMERVRLDKKLIRTTYLFYFLFFLPALVLPLVLGLIFLKELVNFFPGSSFWWLLLAYFGWGVFLIFLTEVFHKKLFLKRKF
jgi:hypothetical protein